MFCIPKYYALMLVLSTLVQYIVTVFISKGRQIIPSNPGLPFRLLRCRSNFTRAHMLSCINVLTTPAVNLTIFVSFIPCFDKFWNNYADSKKVKWSFLQDDNSLILVYYPNGHPYRNLKHGNVTTHNSLCLRTCGCVFMFLSTEVDFLCETQRLSVSAKWRDLSILNRNLRRSNVKIPTFIFSSRWRFSTTDGRTQKSHFYRSPLCLFDP